jgi:DNA-binding CsgD family transcriptional regulator
MTYPAPTALQNGDLRKRNAERVDFQSRLGHLDERERAVLDLILTGSGNRAIEGSLALSTRTLNRVRAAILEKMGFLSFVELSVAYGAFQSDHRGPRTNAASTEGLSGAAPHSPSEHAASQDDAARRDGDVRSFRCDLHDRALQSVTTGLLRIRTILAHHEIGEELEGLLRESEAALTSALAEIGDLAAGRSLGSDGVRRGHVDRDRD